NFTGDDDAFAEDVVQQFEEGQLVVLEGRQIGRVAHSEKLYGGQGPVNSNFNPNGAYFLASLRAMEWKRFRGFRGTRHDHFPTMAGCCLDSTSRIEMSLMPSVLASTSSRIFWTIRFVSDLPSMLRRLSSFFWSK